MADGLFMSYVGAECCLYYTCFNILKFKNSAEDGVSITIPSARVKILADDNKSEHRTTANTPEQRRATDDNREHLKATARLPALDDLQREAKAHRREADKSKSADHRRTLSGQKQADHLSNRANT